MTINIAEFEAVLPDAEAIRSATDSFRGTVSSINTTATTTASTWARLQGGVYDVPGKERVFSAFVPVTTAAEDLVDNTETLHAATFAYADAVDALKARLEGVKADAAAFYSEVDGRPQDEWDDDEGLVEKELAIIGALDQLYADLQAAQRDCANAISGMYGGPSYVETTEGGAAAGQVAYGYSKEQLDAAAVAGDIPWGKPTEWDKPWYRDVGDGIASFGKGLWSGVTGTVTGLANMVGINGAEAFKQTWVGIGKLAVNVAIVTTPFAQVALRASGNGDVVDRAGAELLAVGKAAVHWDEWQSDPAYAAGATTFDLATILLTAGAGAAVKGSSVAGKVATVGGTAGKVVKVTGVGRVAVGTVRATDFVQGVKVSTITVTANAGRTAIGKVDDLYRAGATRVGDTVRNGVAVMDNTADRIVNAVSPQPAFAGGAASRPGAMLNAVETHTGSRGGGSGGRTTGGSGEVPSGRGSSGGASGSGSSSLDPARSGAARQEEFRRQNAGRYGETVEQQPATSGRTAEQPATHGRTAAEQPGTPVRTAEQGGGAGRSSAAATPDRAAVREGTSNSSGEVAAADRGRTSGNSSDEAAGADRGRTSEAPVSAERRPVGGAAESGGSARAGTTAGSAAPKPLADADPPGGARGGATQGEVVPEAPPGRASASDTVPDVVPERVPSASPDVVPERVPGTSPAPSSDSPFAHPVAEHGTPVPDSISRPAEHANYGRHNDAPDAPTRLEGSAALPEQVHPDLRQIVDPDQPRYGVDEHGNALTEAEYANRYAQASPQGVMEWDRYPDNAGAVEGTVRQYDTLGDLRADLGDVTVDRIGANNGSFLAVEGTPWNMRSLPVNTLGKELHHFEFNRLPEGYRVEVSEIAPAFGREGGGTQLRIVDAASGRPANVNDLLDAGVLRETPRGASAARAFAVDGVPPVRNIVDVQPEQVGGPRTAWARADHELAPNTQYEVPGRGRFTTNDEGRIVLVETRGGIKGDLNPDLQKPLPNTTYRVNDDVVYRTDEQGRTVDTHIEDYSPGDSFRSESIQRSVGHTGMEEMHPGIDRADVDRLFHYDGGHLHGAEAGGIAERINLQPMLRSLNQGSSSTASFYGLERTLIKLAEGPLARRITVDIESIFGEGHTPRAFTVQYAVDGKVQGLQVFRNQ